jgi:pimeloyl-ACP methyl ester carboxylesterase
VTEYGREAHAPSLWIYSDNDHFFPPFIATQMFRAYTDAGAPANLERLPAIGTDGHNLFTANAEKLWAPAVDRFLLGLGLPSGKASVLED